MRADDVMTPDPVCISSDASINGRDSKLVGIVTRANLLHALASVAAETKPGAGQ